MNIEINILVVVLFILLIAIISNQYAGLKQMRSMQRSLDDLNQKVRDMQRER